MFGVGAAQLYTRYMGRQRSVILWTYVALCKTVWGLWPYWLEVRFAHAQLHTLCMVRQHTRTSKSLCMCYGGLYVMLSRDKGGLYDTA
jgi:hypothetical protein